MALPADGITRYTEDENPLDHIGDEADDNFVDSLDEDYEIPDPDPLLASLPESATAGPRGIYWREAPSLVRLTGEVNRKFPGRDMWSEGSLGDTSHANRFSDHNPDAAGWTHAHDYDATTSHTMGPGTVGDFLIAAMLRLARSGKRHPINYLIYKGRIYSRGYGFRSRYYTGSNSHHSHVHVSVDRTDWARNWPGPWFGDLRKTVDISAVKNAFESSPASAPKSITRLQERLENKGDLKKPYRHGYVGIKTRRAMKRFEKRKGFVVQKVPGAPAIRELVEPKYRARA